MMRALIQVVAQMPITVFGGAPGAGKSVALIAQVARTPGLYLLACPRIDLIEERVRDLTAAAVQIGAEPNIAQVHTETKRGLPVAQRVRERMAAVKSLPHAVIAITHDTLMMLDPSEIIGWHVAIDEQVAGLCGNSHVIPVTVRLLRDSFDIVPTTKTGWGRLVPRPGAITYGEALRDASLKGLVDLVKWAGSPHGVMVDALRWEEIEGSNRPLGWVSAWTYGQLRHAASATIAAASLDHTLTYLATRLLDPDTEFEHRNIPVAREIRPTVVLHYFVAEHRGSSHFWSPTQAGAAGIAAIARCLEGRDIGYWASNDTIKQHFLGRLSGVPVSVKIEGSNALRDKTSCALIYSGKPRYEDEPLRRFFGWGKGVIERARECEDILQFVQRGIIRCAEFGGVYHIYLYDKWQADWLGDYFVTNGIAAVELVAEHEPGLMEVKRPQRGRQPDLTRTTEEKAEARRARDKARKERERRAKGIKPRKKKSAPAT